AMVARLKCARTPRDRLDADAGRRGASLSQPSTKLTILSVGRSPLDASPFCNPAEIVAGHLDDHYVFGLATFQRRRADVPFIGRAVIRSCSRKNKSSGDAEQIALRQCRWRTHPA